MTVINDTNYNGDTGEKVVALRLSLPDTVCRIALLGEKWPVIDALIEFEKDGRTFYFFAQVKSTALGPQGEGEKKRLEIDLDKKHHEKLAGHIGPTYLIGVDLSGGALSHEEKIAKAYICTVKEQVESGVYSLPISDKHELSRNNVIKLFEEVIAFWEASPTKKSNYESSFER